MKHLSVPLKNSFNKTGATVYRLCFMSDFPFQLNLDNMFDKCFLKPARRPSADHSCVPRGCCEEVVWKKNHQSVLSWDPYGRDIFDLGA